MGAGDGAVLRSEPLLGTSAEAETCALRERWRVPCCGGPCPVGEQLQDLNSAGAHVLPGGGTSSCAFPHPRGASMGMSNNCRGLLCPLPSLAPLLQQERGWCLCAQSSACALLEAVGSSAGDGGRLQRLQQAPLCLPRMLQQRHCWRQQLRADAWLAGSAVDGQSAPGAALCVYTMHALLLACTAGTRRRGCPSLRAPLCLQQALQGAGPDPASPRPPRGALPTACAQLSYHGTRRARPGDAEK